MPEAGKLWIRAEIFTGRAAGDRAEIAVLFYVMRGNDELESAVVSLTRRAWATAHHRIGTDPPLVAAMTSYGLERLQAAFATPGWEDVLPNDNEWILGSDQLDMIDSFVIREKTCRYQRVAADDLYCVATSRNDQTADRVVDGLTAAPTSHPLCAGCSVPDRRLVCSAFMHPRVVGVDSGGNGSVTRRTLIGATCAKGYLAIDGDPKQCMAGGHPCWHRDVESPKPPASHNQLDVLEALDYLDIVWRLAFGGRSLFQGTSLVDVAGLALDCAGPEDFEQRMSDLAAVLDRIKVDDEDIPANDKGERPARSLARLQAAVIARSEDGLSAAAETGLTTLRRLVRIRSAMQHSGAQLELPKTFGQLGMTWPAADWAQTWREVRGHAAGALAAIRDDVRAFVP